MNGLKKLNTVNVLKISGAFLAFLIGSGFATGQESTQFFAAYGVKGVLGGFVVMFAFMWLMKKFLDLGKKKGITVNEDVYKYYAGNILGTMYTWYVMTFIVAVFAVMAAGAGATLSSYGIPPIVGNIAITLLALATILLGLQKLIDILAIIGPVIVVLTISIAVVAILQNFSDIAKSNEIIPTLPLLKASPNWLLSAFIYVGLSILGLASFLPPVGKSIKDDREVTFSSMLGPVLFAGGLILVSLAIMSQIEGAHKAQVPILYLANDIMPIYGTVFAIIIFFGIYTTATPLLWTVCNRFAQEGTNKYRIIAVVLAAVGFLGSTVLPFGKLVNIIYPTIGWVGLSLFVLVIFKELKTKLIGVEKQVKSDPLVKTRQ